MESSQAGKMPSKVFLIAFTILAAQLSGMMDAAESSIVVDVESGVILLSKDPDSKRQVASLTKVATALVALEWLDKNEMSWEVEITVSPEAVSGGVNPLAMRAGDRLSLESALLAAMMASDNTSAYAVAEFIGGKMQGGVTGSEAVKIFVQAINREVEALGLKDTRFVNPHGLDEGNELGISTAADMALLAICALEHPKFLSLCSMKMVEIEIERGRDSLVKTVRNTNDLVGSRGIDGMKTGTTRRAGPCLIATAVAGNEDAGRLVTVVLNAEDRFRETVLLLSRGWEERRRLESQGSPVTNRRLLSPAK